MLFVAGLVCAVIGFFGLRIFDSGYKEKLGLRSGRLVIINERIMTKTDYVFSGLLLIGLILLLISICVMIYKSHIFF